MPLPTIMGEFRSGGDAQLKFLPSGQAVASFSIIASSAKKLDNGEWETTGESGWLRASAWGSFAEQVAETVTKGVKVFIVGKMSQRTWTTNEGEERTSMEVRLDACQVIPPRNQESQPQQRPQTTNDNRWDPPLQDDEPPF